jgi:hypothetical protein
LFLNGIGSFWEHLAEQGNDTENPCVDGSIPPPGSTSKPVSVKHFQTPKALQENIESLQNNPGMSQTVSARNSLYPTQTNLSQDRGKLRIKGNNAAGGCWRGKHMPIGKQLMLNLPRQVRRKYEL